MWTFPALFAIFAIAAAVVYTARKGVTIDNRQGTQGSLAMCFVAFIFMGIVGWVLDFYFDWSLIVHYMWVVAGILQMVAIAIVLGLVFLFISMFYTANKCGHVVA